MTSQTQETPYLISSEWFDAFLAECSERPYIAIDTEASGDEIRDGRGFAIGVSVAFRLPGTRTLSEYFAFRHRKPGRNATGDCESNLDRSYLSKLKKMIESHPCVVFHNAKFDLVSLASLGINVTGKFYDTMLMAHWVDENVMSKKLDYLSKHYLKDSGKARSDDFNFWINHYGWLTCPPDLMREYAAYDAELTLRLYEHLLPAWIAEEYDKPWERYQEFIRLIIKMESRGVRIDMDLAKAEFDRGKLRMAEIMHELGYNPASSKDLELLLIEQMGLPIVKLTPGGKPSFDKEAMAEYEVLLANSNDDRASKILEFRGYQTVTGLNIKPCIELISPDGRLRPNYKLHGTVTGRLSCEKPNLQQIPRSSEKAWNGNLKSIFIAQEGYTLWEADYSQLEFRLGAAYAQERFLIEIFNSGRDIFTEMSEREQWPRQNIKTRTYTIQFGGGAKRLSDVFRVTLQEGARIKEEFFQQYPGFKQVMKLAENTCLRKGYVKTWSGRRRHFNFPKEEKHKAFNAVIQGGAADIVRDAMLRLEKEVDSPTCRMLLQIHDSIVFEIKNGEEDHYLPIIKKVMEAVEPYFGVQFAVSVKKWGSKE